MKYIKTLLLLPLVAAIAVIVLAAVTVLYLGALLVGIVWRWRDLARPRHRDSAAEKGDRPRKGSDAPWELRP